MVHNIHVKYLYNLSILYKLKLPFIIVFNKIDVAPHDFAMSWMEDLRAFQEALEKERDQSYMSSMLSSMSMVLDEFYKNLRCVGVSAATGEGMDELFHAIEEASKEYYQDYLPALEKRIAEVAKARSNLASASNENGQSNATVRGNGSERIKSNTVMMLMLMMMVVVVVVVVKRTLTLWQNCRMRLRTLRQSWRMYMARTPLSTMRLLRKVFVR